MKLEGELLTLAVELARNKSVSPPEGRGNNNNKTGWQTKYAWLFFLRSSRLGFDLSSNSVVTWRSM
jgi:hypothetical protein